MTEAAIFLDCLTQNELQLNHPSRSWALPQEGHVRVWNPSWRQQNWIHTERGPNGKYGHLGKGRVRINDSQGKELKVRYNPEIKRLVQSAWMRAGREWLRWRLDTRDISTRDCTYSQHSDCEYSQLFKTGLVILNCIAWSAAIKTIQLLAHQLPCSWMRHRSTPFLPLLTIWRPLFSPSLVGNLFLQLVSVCHNH